MLRNVELASPRDPGHCGERARHPLAPYKPAGRENTEFSCFSLKIMRHQFLGWWGVQGLSGGKFDRRKFNFYIFQFFPSRAPKHRVGLPQGTRTLRDSFKTPSGPLQTCWSRKYGILLLQSQDNGTSIFGVVGGPRPERPKFDRRHQKM